MDPSYGGFFFPSHSNGNQELIPIRGSPNAHKVLCCYTRGVGKGNEIQLCAVVHHLGDQEVDKNETKSLGRTKQ